MWSEKDKMFSRINALLLILVLTSENKIQMPETEGKCKVQTCLSTIP
jgi:hypothetical protein